MTPSDHFRRPWTLVEHRESFSVESASGVILAYFYFEDELTRRQITRRMTREEARRMAHKVVQLPELIEELRLLRAGRDDPA